MKADLTHVMVGFEDGTFELWSRHTVASAGEDGSTSAGPELGPLAGHTDLIKSVDLSTNLLVSGSWDGGIRLWLRTRQKGMEAGVCLGISYHHQGGNSMALKLLVNVVGIFSLDTCELLRVETLLFIHRITLEPKHVSFGI